ncbi:saccharopine dehydrogenase NADP-binding domain-containing protein [Phycicoccus endophyticus]|uniref:Saccharopine dehydrogenase NADP-binding domain-containing protein n=1 Tax=Phycicoccus endophyticus TaxID=1690220 RepID=A0A7G9R0E1_9MICO|nr:saccharopine dehydrogenase NADP-binding domain-containing protein [Phycicoccus endophyticus]NHI20119.1 enoyl-ACP reductase [Phycicoccus endophyticus]QNN49066.1 saccharopine dehydrogenase NADP-binding domain-containing protein [Phycicoccus endophyticus]GGL38236.1 enoyl reductase [Phycicoccus endophyticus]
MSDLDLVLVGASGFVGRLTARHLAEHAPAGLRVALAGRSRERLEEVRVELPGEASDWPLVVLDVLDEDAVADLAGRTRVLVTTVGPYDRYGRALVAACARAGTHYLDLTGEVLFVHHSVTTHHATAQRTGARIVHACGFDSVPSDLGVLLCADAAWADGAELATTRLAVRRMSGGFSGGTVDSVRGQAVAMRADPQARRVAADPWALAEGGRPAGPSATPSTRRTGLAGLGARLTRSSPVRREPETGHFTGPFVMAAFNTRIVARSASLLHYGARFRYAEYTDYGPGPRGAAVAGAVSAGLLAVLGGLALAPTRALLGRVLPSPGEGPSPQAMAAGRFRMEVTATASTGARYRSVVAAPYDPGYSGTAVMLGQSALALAAEDPGLPDAAGVLTPATALGHPLVDRLRAHGFTLDVERLEA